MKVIRVFFGLMALAAFAGCTRGPTELTGSNEASVMQGASSVCGDMKRAAEEAIKSGSVLDYASEFDEAVERERETLAELVARAKACEGDTDTTSNGSCEGFTSGMASEYEARLTALDDCNPGNTPPTGISASKACRKVNESNVWINASCEVSKTRLLATFEKGAIGLCKSLATLSLTKVGQAPGSMCAASVISEVCGLVANTASVSAKTADQGKDIVGGTVGNALAQSVTKSFINAAVQCIKEQGTQAIVETLEETAAADVAQTAFRSSLTKASALGIALGTTACKVASDQVADAISTTRGVDYENACSAEAFSFKNKQRMAACMKTAGSACAAYGGAINLGDLAGVDPGSAESFFASVASGGVTAACSIAGPATRALCGTINQAALQIKQALTTGTNDWATCLGTAQLGACIGTLYANWESGGWTNNSGVEEAQGDGEEQTRACCRCFKDTYQNDGWFDDTRISQENWFGVIQSGDYESGNCAWMEHKGKQNGGVQLYTPDGYEIYYRYSQCARVTVKGDSCAPAEDGTIRVLDPDRNEYVSVTATF